MAIRLASWAFRLMPWGAEDTTVSLAFILLIPFPALVLIMFSYGLGRDIWVLQPDEVTMLLKCQPIQHYWNGWDGEHAGKCLSLQNIVLTHVTINVCLDVWMLILPLTQIYKLKLPLRRKISVMAMFSLGIFLTIVSIIRIKSLLDFAKTPDITTECYERVRATNCGTKQKLR
ncbi:hypothetical protein CGCA056_v009027 [Colletotrichum aenigma]|uniref:uncharacterized protein n=1 Tax=Colletotrichum aenigma TaxID=1215731 RepID=UPI0018723A96|nr:uncharacterized protein CGCA056_v009027 [Colletotrichum aenigma]KAF5519204.1 hypothetical protein CGCA056_v009027 [Colletotrichum aenigma]